MLTVEYLIDHMITCIVHRENAHELSPKLLQRLRTRLKAERLNRLIARYQSLEPPETLMELAASRVDPAPIADDED
jgi:hypothetical protein